MPLPKTEIIACLGVGYDAIDVVAAKARKIAVTNTPDVLTDDVADLALGLLIDVARHITRGDRFVRSGGWIKGGLEFGTALTGLAEAFREVACAVRARIRPMSELLRPDIRSVPPEADILVTVNAPTRASVRLMA